MTANKEYIYLITVASAVVYCILNNTILNVKLGCETVQSLENRPLQSLWLLLGFVMKTCPYRTVRTLFEEVFVTNLVKMLKQAFKEIPYK